MIRVVVLDVSEQEPPQPMHSITGALADLNFGEVLHVLHRRKPTPLFELLKQRQYHFLHCELSETEHHIWFWHSGDDEAEQKVRELKHEINRA